jgi:hypothetical protein
MSLRRSRRGWWGLCALLLASAACASLDGLSSGSPGAQDGATDALSERGGDTSSGLDGADASPEVALDSAMPDTASDAAPADAIGFDTSPPHDSAPAVDTSFTSPPDSARLDSNVGDTRTTDGDACLPTMSCPAPNNCGTLEICGLAISCGSCNILVDICCNNVCQLNTQPCTPPP